MRICQEQCENVLVPESVQVSVENNDLCCLLFDADAKSLTGENAGGRWHAGRAFSRWAHREMKCLARHFSNLSDDLLTRRGYAILAEFLGPSVKVASGARGFRSVCHWTAR
jgi:hypothetical protein